MRGGRSHLAVSAALVVLAACKGDEVDWIEFNAADETLVVEVTAEPTVGEPVTIDLMSNLGLTNVGTATIDPGSGPVGTLHVLSVEVFDAYEAIVGRVTVDVQSQAVADLDEDGEKDSRGEGLYELERDSANPGGWALTLQSLGAEDETREDRFTIVLWQPEQLAAADDDE
jgi:hypothetical protein